MELLQQLAILENDAWKELSYSDLYEIVESSNALPEILERIILGIQIRKVSNHISGARGIVVTALHHRNVKLSTLKIASRHFPVGDYLRTVAINVYIEKRDEEENFFIKAQI